VNALTSGSGRRIIEALRTSTHLLPHHLQLGLEVFFLLRILLLLLKGSEYVTESSPPLFRDLTAALDQHVDDLLSCLTLDERIDFLHQFTPADARLPPPRRGRRRGRGDARVQPRQRAADPCLAVPAGTPSDLDGPGNCSLWADVAPRST